MRFIMLLLFAPTTGSIVLPTSSFCHFSFLQLHMNVMELLPLRLLKCLFIFIENWCEKSRRILLLCKEAGKSVLYFKDFRDFVIRTYLGHYV